MTSSLFFIYLFLPSSHLFHNDLFSFSKSFACDSREYYPFSPHYNINKVKQPFLKVARKMPEPLSNYAFDYFSALIIFNKCNYHLTRENCALVAWVIELGKNKKIKTRVMSFALCVFTAFWPGHFSYGLGGIKFFFFKTGTVVYFL